ncbi:MAG: endonuclease/exonuclease/phosphatase family protein [Saprospiraceae bacterium]
MTFCTTARKIFPIFIFVFLSFLHQAYAQKKQFEIACVGFYNLENLFDTINQVDVIDEEFTPNGTKKWNYTKYQDKLGRLADVISGVGKSQTPDGLAFFGAAEIENRGVLEDLVKQPKLLNQNYQIVHFDSPDARGIDVAFLYQAKYFTLLDAHPVPMVKVDTSEDNRKTRDILVVHGIFKGDHIYVMVNHWPSRRGGERTTAPFRNTAAGICKQISDSIRTQDPSAKVIVMGDLNDDPINDSMLKYLRANGDRATCLGNGFYNPFMKFYKDGNGTLAYQDAWSLFDQIIMSCGLANSNATGWKFYQAGIYKQPWMVQTSGRYEGYPLRTFDGDTYMYGYSDHFPTYLYLIKEKN